jgi:Fe-S-cluster-containing dehydrogenase component
MSNEQYNPNIEEMTEQELFDHLLQQDRTREAAILQGMNRRSFMKLMGASLAMTGFGLAGCASVNPPEGAIIPYVEVPESVIPGRPVYFASSIVMGGYATGLLIETHQGRPTRVEGNKQHPASLGASTAMIQASLLELYNTERSVNVRNLGDLFTWDDFATAFDGVLSRIERNQGEGLRILTEAVSSPTMVSQIEQLTEQFPGAKWYQYEPIAGENAMVGAQRAFGEPVSTAYHFDKANVVLSLDGDFLTSGPASIRYAHDFMQQRKVRVNDGATSMNRLYAVESTPTNTGAMADHRLALSPSQVETFARALAAALGVETVTVPDEVPWDAAWFDAVLADLQANEGAGIVIPGDEQSANIHALAHAINAALGNAGETVTYIPSVVANPTIGAEQLSDLIAEIEENAVDVLLIFGGNPALTAPADIPFAGALERVAFSVHLSLYNNETSQICTWHVPQAHYVEAWSDARAFDGSASVLQPPIGPLYDNVRSGHQMLAMLMRDERSVYEIVRDYWQADYDGDNFDAFWRKALHDGVVPDSAPEAIQPQIVADFALPESSASGLEVIFRPDPALWDGRFANNSWLQELPHPITKISWDTAALMSETTAEELGVEKEDLIDLRFGTYSVQMPVWTVPGHADNTITVYLGYGQGISSELEDDYAFNAYTLRTSDRLWTGSGVEITPVGEKYSLATIQGEMNVQEGEVEPIHTGTLDTFLADNKSIHKGDYSSSATLLNEDEYDGYAWGMSIDLTSCIGCNACMIACQMENNIPTVGKEGISRNRDMYWIRLDRYYIEEEITEELKTYFQPVPCMQCEKAPCEIVCPVHATVHSSEGLNDMIYNRCIGTRYCSANCPYSVRRFNFFDYVNDAPIMQEWRNPDVSVRAEGVMEKCTYCVQRINEARIDANNANRTIADGEVVPACASACPTQAIIFGNLNDPDSQVTQLKAQPQDYSLLAKLNTQPRTTYMARLTNPNDALNGSEEEV